MASGHVYRVKQAEHMAAPTNAASVRILLANLEPSTHGPNSDIRLSGTLVWYRHHPNHPPMC